ncbi:MAG: SDR family oxidoreductase [Nocardioidaceae bacterium]
MVEELLDRGCRVLATDVQDPVPESMSGRAKLLYRRVDVRSDEDWAAALAWVEASWNGLDLLFNNAGVAAGGRIELTDMDQWQWIVDSTSSGWSAGAAPCADAQGATLRPRRQHRVGGRSRASPRMSEYNTVKAGVVALSETLTHELKPFGIAVSVVCPTFFRTNLSSSLRGNDPESRAAAELIDGARVSAAEIAAEVLKGVDAGRPSS